MWSCAGEAALIAVVDEGGFTGAGDALGVSQAAISRQVASLEGALGVRLLLRSTRSVAVTAVGADVVARARRVLAEVDGLVRFAADGARELRVGYAWAALGRHTAPVQARWAAAHPEQPLVFINENSRTAGLAEGTADVAVVRIDIDDPRIDSALVGTERRWAAVPASDPLARKRSIALADLADRTLGVDDRTSTTSSELWRGGRVPAFRPIRSVDDWLTMIAAGQIVGVSAESTTQIYPRPGVVYRPLKDAPPVPVRLAWWREAPPSRLPELLGLVSSVFSGSSG